jgi:uncharacterized Zn finger protein (UPF0148 family)
MKCPNEQCNYFSNVNSSQCYMCGGKDTKQGGTIVCPFCGEGDFDLIGLKFHLGDCEKFDSTEVIHGLFR